MNTRRQSIRVDVFSDIACPFCYIADIRLERVLEPLALEVDWIWHPFQLQPGLPERGQPWDSFSAQKFGGAQGRRAAFAQVVANGSSERVEFDFERMPVAPNTMNAHRLVLLASDHGLGRAAAMALYRAYFCEAIDITDPQELERIALEVGLESDVLQGLRGNKYRSEVQASQLEAQRLGISGVPFLVFEQTVALSGAQPSQVFSQALKQALQSSNPASGVS